MAVAGLNEARRRITAAALEAGRDPEDVALVVVTKGQSDAAVEELYGAGHRLFAENRPDALTARLDGSLPTDIVWHYVGTVQRRKAKVVSPRIELLHSMDRERLESVWASQPDAPPVLLQVNLAGETQKHGYEPGAVRGAAMRLTELGVTVRGLMTLPPAPKVAEDSRGWFIDLARLGAELQAVYPDAIELSMGMSDDYEVAVAAGSTMVRLGRTIFGWNQKHHRD